MLRPAGKVSRRSVSYLRPRQQFLHIHHEFVIPPRTGLKRRGGLETQRPRSQWSTNPWIVYHSSQYARGSYRTHKIRNKAQSGRINVVECSVESISRYLYAACHHKTRLCHHSSCQIDFSGPRRVRAFEENRRRRVATARRDQYQQGLVCAGERYISSRREEQEQKTSKALAPAYSLSGQ